MDNDDALVGRIFSRRDAIRLTARAGVGLAIAGMFRGSTSFAAPTTQPHLPLVASPTMTEGPFFVDEKLNRTDLTSGTTRKSVVNGLPLALAFTVYKLTGDKYAPLPGAQVDVWHADAAGVYSDEDHPMNHENTASEKWLRGYQLSDDDGNANFKTIFPGWYRGRAPHIHFKVRQMTPDGKSTADFTSQLFFHEADANRIYSQGIYAANGAHDTRNTDDGIFTERQKDGSMAGDYMLLDLTRSGAGYAAAFPIILTDANLNGRSGRAGFRGPPPRRRD